MRPESWLDSLFGNVWRVRVLRMLSRDPGRMWTERELARALDASPNTINLAVKALRDVNLLEFRRLGSTHGIRLRSDLDVVRRLGTIFSEERSTLEDLRRAIRAVAPPGVACLLFGSTARGDSAVGSDVDLLVLARTLESAEQAATVIRQTVAAILPVDLHVISLGARELKKRRREPWLQNALSEAEPLTKTLAGAIA